MPIAEITYEGSLRTAAVHAKSASRIITDAPEDNHGRGEAFSPTDLLATSLGCCMLTVMGIEAEKQGWDIAGSWGEVEKVMAAKPRKVSEVHVRITMPGQELNLQARKVLEKIARECPVAQSLHPEIVQKVEFTYE